MMYVHVHDVCTDARMHHARRARVDSFEVNFQFQLPTKK